MARTEPGPAADAGHRGAVQIALAAAAWADLAGRRPEEVNGGKPVWAWVIAVNFVGPLAYLRWGRRKRRGNRR